MIELPNVTLVSYVLSEDRDFYERTDRVMRYMQTMFGFGRSILFSFIPPPTMLSKSERIQIPPINIDGANIWLNTGLPPFIETEKCWIVHEDGFCIDESKWKPEFLDWDYLGAAWADGVVGNGGNTIISRRLMQAAMRLPFSVKVYPPPDGWAYYASDVWLCRIHREFLESKGFKWAPRDLALEFSVEQLGADFPSMGYHGRTVVPHIYDHAWKCIGYSEVK